MTFDLDKIAQGKLEFPRRLAARTIKEKLAMLDALCARPLALRDAKSAADKGTL
jgi:hypothetical protein